LELNSEFKKLKNLSNIDCWIFDLDNTLYPVSTNLFTQINVNMSKYIMDLLKVDRDVADKMRHNYWQEYGTSLAGLRKNFEIEPDHFLEFVHDIDFSVLSKDADLLDVLKKLPGRKIVYTNGTAPYAKKVLEQIGIIHVFDEIYGIESANYIPKPSPEAYEIIFSKAKIVFNRSAMFEDEMRNLKVPYNLGLKTILICDTPSKENFVNYSTKNLVIFLQHFLSTSLNETNKIYVST
tara:strand:+ start:540 stop:1247 length:708 start_codon:yes stop_codon:yes gene_type:complete